MVEYRVEYKHWTTKTEYIIVESESEEEAERKAHEELDGVMSPYDENFEIKGAEEIE